MKTLKLMIAVIFVSAFSMNMFAQAVEKPEETYKKGMEAMKLFKYAEAIKFLDVTIEKDSNMASAYYYRAVCKCNLGLKAEACPDLKKASELGHYVEKVAIPCDCDAKDPKQKQK